MADYFDIASPESVKRWSKVLSAEAQLSQFFAKFTGTSPDSIIYRMNDLQKAPGDKVTFTLARDLVGPGIAGGEVLENSDGHTSQAFASDSLAINLMQRAARLGSRMNEQRLNFKLSTSGKMSLGAWNAAFIDEMLFIHLSGSAGINTYKAANVAAGTYTDHADNALVAPDANHHMFAGDATSALDLDSSDVFDFESLVRISAAIETSSPLMSPVSVGEGEDRYVVVMHPFQKRSLYYSASNKDWVDIVKNAGIRGGKNPLFKKSIGTFDSLVLHQHARVVKFDDYGADQNLTAARALILGAQAGVVAYGLSAQGKGVGYSLDVVKHDLNTKQSVVSEVIVGAKKCIFDSEANAVIAFDSYISPTA